MRITYNPDVDTVIIQDEGIALEVQVNELLSIIPTEEARLELLRSQIHQIRRNRLNNMDEFIQRIKELTVGIHETRNKMIECDPETEGKKIKALTAVTMAYSREIMGLKEIRHVNKLLHHEEGWLLARIAELSV